MTDRVREAIERWVAKGLLDPEHAARLRDEAVAEASEGSRRWTQYALAGLAGAVVVVAAGTFLGWAWPLLDEEGRVFVLALVAAGLEVGAVRLALDGRVRPVSHLLEATALALVLVAGIYSKSAWPDASIGGVLVGMLALALPALTLPFRSGRDPVVAALRTAFSYPLLALFLDRSLGLSAEAIVWILDGMVVVVLCVLGLRLLRRGREEGGWELAVLTTSLFGGLVLALLTGTVVLDMGEQAVWGVDLWLALLTGLLLWGIHGAPPGLRRPWFPRLLAWTVVLGVPLLFFTVAETLDASPWAVAAVVGAWGAGFLAYAVPRGMRGVVLAAAVAVVSAAWYLGVETARELGAVLALGFTGAFLFWLATRMGREERETHGSGDLPGSE